MFPLNRRKTLEAMGVLLNQLPTCRMKYLKLLKLLYVADRETLRDKGHLITGGMMSAMPHGPTNSFACDFVRGLAPIPAWNRYIVRQPGYFVALVEKPGEGSLSKYEIRKLVEVFERYKHLNEFQLRDLTHKLPEYVMNNPGRSSRPIPLRDMLSAVGREANIEGVQEEADAACALGQATGL